MMSSSASIQWESRIGLVPCSPTQGRATRYMKTMSAVPVTAAILSPAPAIIATPIPRRPTMNRTSPTGLRKSDWKISANGCSSGRLPR